MQGALLCPFYLYVELQKEIHNKHQLSWTIIKVCTIVLKYKIFLVSVNQADFVLDFFAYMGGFLLTVQRLILMS